MQKVIDLPTAIAIFIAIVLGAVTTAFGVNLAVAVILFSIAFAWIIACVIYRYWACITKGKWSKIITAIIMIPIVTGFAYAISQIPFHDVKISEIKPELQVKPLDIEDSHPAHTKMTVEVLNYSDYTAKNIFLDIKFGDSEWKRELAKASSLSSLDEALAATDSKLMSDLLSEIGEEGLRQQTRDFYNSPLWDELKPGIAIKVHMFDNNKDDILKNPERYFVPPEETSMYKVSQGWKEQIDNTKSGEPITVLFHAVWENEIGREFYNIQEYQLICTKIGTGTSYKFLPK